MPPSTPPPTPMAGRVIDPMKAKLVDHLPPDDGSWAYEVKWDGMRAVAFVEGGRLRLQTVNRLDATDRFPELAGLAEAIRPHDAVLDGEVVALDDRGIPSFEMLQPRMQARTPQAVREGLARHPTAYVLFDLLELDGTPTTELTYEQRRRLLTQLVDPGPRWQVTPVEEDGAALLTATRSQGHEGVIAKRLGSRYEPGRRSSSWLKVKIRHAQELVVGGWLPGQGARAAHFGALLVGYHEPAGGELRYAGRVGTGFDQAGLERWLTLLRSLEVDTCPFTPPPPDDVRRLGHWVRPELVVEVGFSEWTTEGVLRQPVHLGQRLDKDPSEVTRERPASP